MIHTALAFAFSSFWHFAGVLLLLSTGYGLIEASGRALFRVVAAFRPHVGDCELDQRDVINIIARDIAQGGAVLRAIRDGFNPNRKG